MTEPTVIVTCAQVHVYPWSVIFDEFGQKAGRQDMVTRALRRALHEVRSFTLERLHEFLAYRKWPDALAAILPGAF